MVDPRARNQARLGDQVLASERPAKLARRAGPRIDSEDYYYNQHYDPRLHAGEEMVTQHGPRLQNHNLLNIRVLSQHNKRRRNSCECLACG